MSLIECNVFEGDDDDARRWEIAENLHRSDLTVLERSEHIAEWVRLTGDIPDSAQVAPKLSSRGRAGEGRPESGINAAVRELGIDRTEAQRAVKINALSDAAKDAAVRRRLRNTQGRSQSGGRAAGQLGPAEDALSGASAFSPSP
jgi:hypothetical protein